MPLQISGYDAADWDRILAVNLTSAFHTATEAAAGMRAQGAGRIVFFSSVAGRSGHKHHGPYAASKGAINQLMRVIAHEYAHGSMGVQQPLDDCAADPPGGADDGDSHEVSFRSVGIAFACAGCPVEVALEMNAEIARQLPAGVSSCGRCRFR